MNLLKRVSMIILLESDIEAALDFYLKLGLTKIFHLKGRWAELDLDGIKIGLCPTTQTTEHLRNTGLVLEVGDVKGFYERFKQELPFLNEPKDSLHGIMVSIKDPGGNIIDLYQPTPERLRDVLNQTLEQQNGQGCCKEETEECCQDEPKTTYKGCC